MIVEKQGARYDLQIASYGRSDKLFFGAIKATNLDCVPDVKTVNFSYSKDKKVFLIPFIDSEYNRKWLEGKYEHYVNANDFLQNFSMEIGQFITESYEAILKNENNTVKPSERKSLSDVKRSVDSEKSSKMKGASVIHTKCAGR